MAVEYCILFADLTTPIVAWWGAVLATIVVLWDVFKWRRTGPRIRMSVRPDMRGVGEPELEGRTLILVSATNVGERPTTLESLTYVWYPTWWHRLRRKRDKKFFVENPGLQHPFPCKLEVGERWDGRVNQTEQMVEMARTGHLMCELHHACAKRPVAKRLAISSNVPKPATTCTPYNNRQEGEMASGSH